VIADDPSLTARLPNTEWCPVRIVVDSTLATLSPTFAPRKVYTDEHANRTLVLTTADGMGNLEAVARAKDDGVRLIVGETGPDGRVSPAAIRQALVDLELCGVYCEGGPALARSLLSAEEVDYVFHYQCPQTFNSPEALHGPDFSKLQIGHMIEAKLGEDHLRHGYL
jgi:diaminohydroxyphosphoribosylaminopyrimidine deaminase/5-amino-6-(5-phosphoribosylamino)uracil reductase